MAAHTSCRSILPQSVEETINQMTGKETKDDNIKKIYLLQCKNITKTEIKKN
jgi:hypothetical protein